LRSSPLDGGKAHQRTTFALGAASGRKRLGAPLSRSSPPPSLLGGAGRGENLKYLVQTREGTDVACLLFGAAAWQVRARDGYVGWSAAQRDQGLRYVANNSRFVVLPWVSSARLRQPCSQRGGAPALGDWQRKYGHPIWLVETFVDRELFAGACYRAANWRPVGLTRGGDGRGPIPDSDRLDQRGLSPPPPSRFPPTFAGEAA